MIDEIVDSHGHVWADPAEYPWEDDVTPPGAETVVYTVDDYREDMDALGIDRAVLVATPIHGPGSPYTVSCVEADPETFYGIVLVDPTSDDVESHLEDVFTHPNLLGTRLTAAEMSAAPDAFWEWMNDRGKQVHLLLSPDDLEEAIDVVRAYPDVDFVFDHLGSFPTVDGYSPRDPPYDAMSAIGEYSNAYAKITHTPSEERYPFADVHEFVRALVETFGTERLLWGSDYIYHFKKLTPWHTREFLDELSFLSESDRANLLGRTVSERLL